MSAKIIEGVLYRYHNPLYTDGVGTADSVVSVHCVMSTHHRQRMQMNFLFHVVIEQKDAPLDKKTAFHTAGSHIQPRGQNTRGSRRRWHCNGATLRSLLEAEAEAFLQVQAVLHYIK